MLSPPGGFLTPGLWAVLGHWGCRDCSCPCDREGQPCEGMGWPAWGWSLHLCCLHLPDLTGSCWHERCWRLLPARAVLLCVHSATNPPFPPSLKKRPELEF